MVADRRLCGAECPPRKSMTIRLLGALLCGGLLVLAATTNSFAQSGRNNTVQGNYIGTSRGLSSALIRSADARNGRPPSRAASRIPATACTAGASKATITLPAHKIERRVSGALELGNQPYSTDGAAPMAAVLDDFDAARTGRLRGHMWPFNDVDGAAREEQDSLNWRGRSSWRPRPSNFARFEPTGSFTL